MARKLVIDTCSVVNFFRYYYFDKKHGGQINKKLIDFFISKINADEIIIIDKVDVELQKWSDYSSMRERIREKTADTAFLSSKVLSLSDKYFIEENERRVMAGFVNKDDGKIAVQLEREKFENKHADLFLVAYCRHINDSGDEAVLITEETNSKESQKLYPKIPTICNNEHIIPYGIPYLLFEKYRKQLKFSLEVTPEQQTS